MVSTGEAPLLYLTINDGVYGISTVQHYQHSSAIKYPYLFRDKGGKEQKVCHWRNLVIYHSLRSSSSVSPTQEGGMTSHIAQNTRKITQHTATASMISILLAKASAL